MIGLHPDSSPPMLNAGTEGAPTRRALVSSGRPGIGEHRFICGSGPLRAARRRVRACTERERSGHELGPGAGQLEDDEGQGPRALGGGWRTTSWTRSKGSASSWRARSRRRTGRRGTRWSGRWRSFAGGAG